LAELEEAMKPKTCEGDVSDDVGYLHGEAVIRNIKYFHCVQHQPKDNA